MDRTIDSLDPARWATSRPRDGRSRSLLGALWSWLARHRSRQERRAQNDELLDLDARTLADIGAPDRLVERAMARRESQAQELAGLHAGLSSGAWRQW